MTPPFGPVCLDQAVGRCDRTGIERAAAQPIGSPNQ